MKKRVVSALLCCGFALVLVVGQFTGDGIPASDGVVAEIDPTEADLVDDFEESIEVDGTLIPEQEVPLAPKASNAKITTKTTTKTKKTSKKLKTASKKTKKVTKKTTKKQKKSSVKKSETVVTDTTIVTTETTQYKKGSKKINITTKTVTTVKTTTTPQEVTTGNIDTVAKKADPRLLKRFKNQGYKYVIDTGLDSVGLFSSAKKQITMRYQSDIVYHELGHYLAYTTGKMDLTSEWSKIYDKESSKFDGDNKDYVISNCREYFAECYRDYVIRKSTLKSKRPESYAYVEKVLSKL